EVDQTVIPIGSVDFPYDYPKFTDTYCSGLGYSVSYESRTRPATNLIRFVPFKNERKIELDHAVISKNDTLKIAIYADYEPLSDFLEEGSLPDEFVKSFQPSNRCGFICGQIRARPMRPLMSGPKGNCNYFIPGHDDRGLPAQVRTDDLWFFPFNLETAANRDWEIAKLQECDAVRNNQDLENYYKQAREGECTYYYTKTMMREWYFVEQKVPYKAPLYSITNFARLIRATSDTQNESLVNREVEKMSNWVN
ncbi:MAG: hypothetical protein KGQ59_03460, partial [Bdellovibrionales bacterium]|nr:hypothetical protein [Bdellovibrionales bacterium]